jgi:hypothetical protein
MAKDRGFGQGGGPEVDNGNSGLHSAAGSRRGRCGFPILQEPVLGTADGEYRNRPGVRSVLLEISEASMSTPG